MNLQFAATTWGVNGYGKMKRGVNICDISSNAVQVS